MQPFVSTVTAASLGLGSIATMNSVAPSVVALVSGSLRPELSAGKRLRMNGFSLIELMVVMVMVAILAAIAAPSFTVLLQNNRLAAASSALQVSLSLARSEAVKRGADARVTVAANGAVGTWTNGWTVFVDRTTNANLGLGPAADSATVTRLEVAGPPSAPVSFDQTFGALNYFSYNGQGRMIDATGAGVVNRSFWFFYGTSQKFCLIVNNTGRVRAARADSSASCPSA
ncbi:MAG: GspH/FimT family pseudopilin [Polaromonas sp.]